MGKGGGSENRDMSNATIASTNSRTAEYNAGTEQLNSSEGWKAVNSGWTSLASVGKGMSEGVKYIDSTSFDDQAAQSLAAAMKKKGIT
jgi:3-hydroxyisobutyrate dehydrogenase-like beta-hydroxyacid dehydrogenase